MEYHPLYALSPLDGRYAKQCDALRPIFSEYGLMYYRLIVEIRWLETLAAHPEIPEIAPSSETTKQHLQHLIDQFDIVAASRIKAIEATTNHDVKAVEYYLKECVAKHLDSQQAVEFVHFACTSEDINNLAYALMLKAAIQNVLLPQMAAIITQLKSMATQYAAFPMLSRTHGQSASPTTVGKEFAVFIHRLYRQYQALKAAEYYGKINGAVGNFNAHLIAYPNINWLFVSQNFVESLTLQWNPYTTQIEPHDYMVEIFNTMNLFNQIMVDLVRDLWGYISLGYFKQKLHIGEIGSSTMPHKVNPIDFENAEGNLGIANSLFQHLARQLPTSRWQRDLVDSTTLRNISSAFGHSLLAYQSCLKGLNKLELCPTRLALDLEQSWEVLAEAVQTVMRRYGIANPYERLKALTRGKEITAAVLETFIESLPLSDTVKQTLLSLTPSDYIGLAAKMAERIPVEPGCLQE